MFADKDREGDLMKKKGGEGGEKGKKTTQNPERNEGGY